MLNIYEIYPAVSGEASFLHQGRLCIIIRFAGCHLQCPYCDAKEAHSLANGTMMDTESIIEEIHKLGNRNILITGGEPLLQAEGLHDLLLALDEEPNTPPDYQIAIETNGSIIIPETIYELSEECFIDYVVDYKLPSSGQQSKMNEYLFQHQIHCDDWVKFVIQTEEDYNFAIEKKRELQEKYYSSANFAFSIALDKNGSPATPGLDHKWLLKKLQDDKQFDSVINLQIHKIIGCP